MTLGCVAAVDAFHLGYDEVETPHPAAINTEDSEWYVLFKTLSQRSKLTIATPKEIYKLYNFYKL